MFIAETYKNKLVIILAICILGTKVNFSFAEQSRKYSRNNNIEVGVGQSFMIMLEPNATTGFKWQLADTLEKNTLELVGTKYIASESNLIGGRR
ncbi:MAG: protease inhibitor I42 family protein [Candidatus Omnitrophota bacterium]|nr:protease inhibitor I42 family protein [Candidatus Omnitrophota bacterium]